MHRKYMDHQYRHVSDFNTCQNRKFDTRTWKKFSISLEMGANTSLTWS